MYAIESRGSYLRDGVIFSKSVPRGESIEKGSCLRGTYLRKYVKCQTTVPHFFPIFNPSALSLRSSFVRLRQAGHMAINLSLQSLRQGCSLTASGLRKLPSQDLACQTTLLTLFMNTLINQEQEIQCKPGLLTSRLSVWVCLNGMKVPPVSEQSALLD